MEWNNTLFATRPLLMTFLMRDISAGLRGVSSSPSPREIMVLNGFSIFADFQINTLKRKHGGALWFDSPRESLVANMVFSIRLFYQLIWGGGIMHSI